LLTLSPRSSASGSRTANRAGPNESTGILNVSGLEEKTTFIPLKWIGLPKIISDKETTNCLYLSDFTEACDAVCFSLRYGTLVRMARTQTWFCTPNTGHVNNDILASPIKTSSEYQLTQLSPQQRKDILAASPISENRTAKPVSQSDGQTIKLMQVPRTCVKVEANVIPEIEESEINPPPDDEASDLFNTEPSGEPSSIFFDYKFDKCHPVSFRTFFRVIFLILFVIVYHCGCSFCFSGLLFY